VSVTPVARRSRRLLQANFKVKTVVKFEQHIETCLLDVLQVLLDESPILEKLVIKVDAD
jgi:hypothetical protein